MAHELDGKRYEQASAHQKEEFDLIFSNAALHWVKDHPRLLANVRRALRFRSCVVERMIAATKAERRPLFRNLPAHQSDCHKIEIVMQMRMT